MAYALIVLDGSAALALVLAEEEGREVEELIHATIAVNGQIFVPHLFWYELGNGLLMAERADRMPSRSVSPAVLKIARFPVVTQEQSDFPIAERILNLARDNGLTYYDASSLELALRFEAPLKSFDSHLQSLKTSFPLII
jgi:predicted nucleic acid-binding protein